MTADSGRARLDTQSLTDIDTYVYETIATLEYTGRPATRSQIAAVTDLDDQALDESLGNLTSHGLVVRTETARTASRASCPLSAAGAPRPSRAAACRYGRRRRALLSAGDSLPVSRPAR